MGRIRTNLVENTVLGSEMSVPTKRCLGTLINPQNYIEGINTFTGKLFFQLPLITFQHKDGTTTAVHLIYNPLQASTQQVDLGLGWGFNKNMIRFNPATKKYSITFQGIDFEMERQVQNGDSKTIPFTISNSSLRILLDPAEAKFRIFKTGGFTQTYEKNPNTENNWLLNEESMPDASRLIYSYDFIGDEPYPKQVAHSDGKQQIALSYKVDTAFKLAKVEIQSFNSSCASFEVLVSEHSLSFIEQENPFCTYAYGNVDSMITSIALPTLQIEYTYMSQDVKSAISANQSYSVKGQLSRIFYGPDYILGCYVDTLGMLIIEKCTGDSFEIEASGNIGFSKRYPPLLLNFDTIESYTILPQKESIIVYLKGIHSGRIFLFNAKLTDDFSVQQPIIQSWEVSPIGAVHPFSQGFYFISSEGCQFYFKKEEEWKVNLLINHTPFPAVFSTQEGAVIYTDSDLMKIKDPSLSLEGEERINGADKAWLSEWGDFAKALSPNQNIQARIQSQMAERCLNWNGNFLVMNGIVFPRDSITPFRIKVQCFENSTGSFQALPSIDNPAYFSHETLVEFSHQFFSENVVVDKFIYQRQIFFSQKQNAFLVRTRNITILPNEEYVNKTLDAINWDVGISYTQQQAIQLKNVSQGISQRNDQIRYTVKQEGGQYVLCYFNASLQSDLNQGKYTFKVESDKNETFLLQPTKIDANVIEIIETSPEGESQKITATPNNESKSLFDFISSLYTLNTPLSGAEFANLIERDEPLPDSLAWALAEISLSWFVEVTDTGRVSGRGWEMGTIHANPQVTHAIQMGDGYTLLEEAGQVSLCQDGEAIAHFPVKHADEILNFYPSCLVYNSQNRIEMLCFHTSTTPNTRPQVNKEPIPFREGQLIPSACYPMNPYFTLAVQEASYEENSSGITLYKVPQLVAETVLQDKVISRQTIRAQEMQQEEQFQYQNPWQFQKNQMLYRSVSKISLDEGKPQGRTVTTLKDNLITKTIFDQDGGVVQSDKNRVQENRGETISADENSPYSLTSKLNSATGGFVLAMIEGAFFESQEADFMSFESYEMGRMGQISDDAPLWKMTGGTIRQGWSLSGQQYLELAPKGTLEVIYKPDDFKRVFSLGVWLRSKSPLFASPVTVTIDFLASHASYEGEVKNTVGQWVYYEAILPLVDLSSEINVASIKVEVRASNQSLDVDSFRFGPIDSALKARVYDPTLRIPTGVFDSRGLFQRLIYSQGQLVATIQPNGSIQSLFYPWNPQFDSALQDCLMPKAYASELTIQPSSGFYEDADPNTIQSRWGLNPLNWQLSPSTITHCLETTDELIAQLPPVFVPDRMGCSFECSNLENHSVITLHFQSYSIPLTPLKWSLNEQPVVLTAIRFHNRFLIFANGQLVIDQQQLANAEAPESPFKMELSGPATLKNLMLFDKPKVMLLFKNFRGQPLQTLLLVKEDQAEISLCIYDALGRKVKGNTPLTVGPDREGHLLTYRQELPSSSTQNYTYDPTPLENVCQLGYSSTDYDSFPSQIVRGTFITLYKKFPELFSKLDPWIPDSLREDAYRYVVTKDPDGVYSIVVQNAEGLPFATYRQTSVGFIQNQFTYQEKSSRLSRHQLPRNFVLELGGDQAKRQIPFERTLDYTENGQLCLTTDPDYGTDLMVHDPESSILRFQVHYNKEGKFSYLLLFDYDIKGCANVVGYHPKPEIMLEGKQVDLNDRDALESALENMASVKEIPDSAQDLFSTMLLIQSSDAAPFSLSLEERGRVQTVYSGRLLDEIDPSGAVEGAYEYFTYDLSGAVVQKDLSIQDKLDSVSYEYDLQGNLIKITYPTEIDNDPFEVVYDYDHLQRVITIKTADDGKIFATFEYVGGSNQISKECFPQINLERCYLYNTSCQLVSIQDALFTQNLTYTSQAFQEKQTYKQLVSSSTYASSWIGKVQDSLALDQLKGKLHIAFPDRQADVEEFVQNLVKHGYLDTRGFLRKAFDLHSLYDLPVILELSKILPILQQQPSLNPVGFQYAYEFADQLSKAKFFFEEPSHSLRFSITSITQFSTKPNIYPFDQELAERLYHELCENDYVSNDGIWNLRLDEGLDQLLLETTEEGSAYLKAYPTSVTNLLFRNYLEGLPLNEITFVGYYRVWTNTKEISPVRLQEGKAAWNCLFTRGFIDSNNRITDKILSPKLHSLVQNLNIQDRLQDVANLVHFYQRTAIGESANDVWVFGEDAHGNMSKYYVGASRYHLSISNTSNQIEYILTDLDTLEDNKKHLFNHDDNGNANTAPHLGIKTIQYHPFSNRPLVIDMEDGTSLQFAYDYKGMRVLKRVTDAKGNWTEIRYLRNQEGQSLFEWHTDNQNKSIEISYIYGPMGLAAFIREGKCYSVVKDHEGSIRLIVDEQKNVVFSTHYLPYGQRTHTYGDPEILSYGYIGQEFDKETGLYNFNARLYDPQIGRFYQVDPLRQYASPYIYAGNSPLSYKDPTGLFSWNAFGGGFISALEIVAGIAVDVFSGGALAEGVGGTLLGAGISGLTYTIESGDKFSWHNFGIEEGIGAAIGAMTAGFGSVEGNIIDKVVGDLAENSFKRALAEGMTSMVIRSVTGIAASSGQTILENVANGRSWDSGLEKAVWMGALTGAASAGIGGLGSRLGRGASEAAGDANSTVLSRGLKSFVVGSVSGFAGDVTGTLIVNAILGQPLDSGLWQASINNVVGGVVAAGHKMNPDRPPLISRGLKLEKIDTKTNCLAMATFRSMQKQEILGSIKDANELRNIASQAMKKELVLNPDSCRSKFKEALENMIHSEEIQGLSPELTGIVEKVLNEDPEGVNTRETLNKLFPDEVVDAYISRYIESIEKGEVWGNFLELDYLSKQLNVKFRINIRGEKWSTIGDRKAENTVFLDYTGDHYNVYFKQGIAFFSKRRGDESLDSEHGFGSGQNAEKVIFDIGAYRNRLSAKLRESLGRAEASQAMIKYKRLLAKFVSYRKRQKLNAKKKAKKAPAITYGITEFATEIRQPVNKEIYEAMKGTVLADMINKGGSYGDLYKDYSCNLLVESNHMPPKGVVLELFDTLTEKSISAVSMLQCDHRVFPSTGRLGAGYLTKNEIKACKEAINDSHLPEPAHPIKTFKDYHEYLKSLYDPNEEQRSYARMLEMEIRVKYKLFGSRYKGGIIEAIDYSENMGFIEEDDAAELKEIDPDD